jgi:hypothetical protein
MVHVKHHEVTGELAAQAVENVEQGHGIGSGRYGNTDALCGREHLVALDVFGDSLKQSGRQ